MNEFTELTAAAVKGCARDALIEHAIIVLDGMGVVVDWSRAAERTFGYGAGEMLGQTIERLFTDDDLKRGELANELRTAAASGRAEDDRWMLRKDGSRFWASGVVTPLHDDNVGVAGFVKILRDRTDMRAHIDAFRNRADAAAALVERRQLSLAAIAHELRNPLAAISNAATVLAVRGESVEARSASVGIIQRQASFMARLLEDLADVTQIDRGQLRLRSSQIELGPVLQQSVEAVADALHAKRQTVEVLAAAPIFLEADSTRLQQVLVNLLANASKFSPSGSQIWLKATVEDAEIAIRVEDRGIGIAGDFLPKVFDLFTQAGTNPVPVAGLATGMGLGLPLAKRLVELHHGTIEAKSDGPGTGTQIVVHLPLRQPPASYTTAG